MLRQIHNLHQPAVGGQARQAEARGLQGLPVLVVELVAVAVALGDLRPAVGGGHRALGLGDAAGIGPQAHGAPLGGDIPLVGHQVDHRIGGVGQLAGVGAGQPRPVAGELHHRHLHAQADAEEGHPVLPGPADGRDHALHPPAAEAAGDDHAAAAGQDLPGVVVGELL